MITDKYKKALLGLKAQSEGRLSDMKILIKGCEAEAGHIYRIMSAHNTNIVNMSEELLDHCMSEEAKSGEPYPNPDRDGLQYVDLNEDVTIYPMTMQGNVSEPINDQSFVLPAQESKSMLSQLREMGRLSMITETIQSLAQRLDGTQLQTAFPNICEVKNCIQNGLNLPLELQKKIMEWELMGATEINFDFVDICGKN